MQIFKKINKYLEKRSKLDIFLIKAGGLVLLYYFWRIVIKFTPFIRPFFIFSRKLLTQVIIKISYFILTLFGYEVNTYKKILWIEGSQGVKIINACLGWSIMAMFIGFIVIYPGKRKSKFWFIPFGIGIIILSNIIRITAMAMVSYHYVHLLDFYHKYVFNIILYLTIFILWIIWVRRYGDKTLA